MSRIYTRQQKRHACFLLKQLEDVNLVSQQTGIPARTLRDWAASNRYAEVKDPALAYESTSVAISAAEIRDRLLKQVEKLTRSPGDDPRKAYYAALAINHLFQQLRALDEVIDIPAPPETPDTEGDRLTGPAT